jgi:hypothetical protein
MTWAPRGILRTTSLRVGRSTRNCGRSSRDGAALVGTDDVVVGEHAGVGVERGPDDQGEEVAALLGVDEEHPLPRFEECPARASGFGGGRGCCGRVP